MLSQAIPCFGELKVVKIDILNPEDIEPQVEPVDVDNDSKVREHSENGLHAIPADSFKLIKAFRVVNKVIRVLLVLEKLAVIVEEEVEPNHFLDRKLRDVILHNKFQIRRFLDIVVDQKLVYELKDVHALPVELRVLEVNQYVAVLFLVVDDISVKQVVM